MDPLPSLQTWPSPFKKLVFTYVLIVFIGVVVGGIMIEVTTHLTPKGVVEQYNGINESQMETAEVMKFPKSVQDMLITTHNHILGLSSIFLIVGFLYLLSVDVKGLQIAIALEPLISLLLTFGGLWVVRYVWDPFVYIVIISGILMIGCFAWMSLVIMKASLQKTE